jgi:formate/nitrite transporter
VKHRASTFEFQVDFGRRARLEGDPMTYVKPAELVETIIDVGASKVMLSTRDTLVRSIMGGAMLTIAAAFAITVSVSTGSPLLGAVLFPVGFIMLYLLGYDLLTGVFVLAPLAWLAKRPGVTIGGILRNWGLVFVGNFIGAFTVAVLMAIVVTYGFSEAPNAVGEAIGHIGEGRTVGYADHGAAGMLTLFIRGVLCNWMVSTGVVLSMVSKEVPGKVIAMWMPIMLFFYMGFEHSIVNMFLFPSGLLLGADFTIMDYLVWNEIPTVVGNLVGGLVFTAIPLYLTYARGSSPRIPGRGKRTRDRLTTGNREISFDSAQSAGNTTLTRPQQPAPTVAP